MSAAPLPGALPEAPSALDLARRRFVRRALGTALLLAPLFLALGWWTSRSFLLRETRFNELGLEIFAPRVAPHGVPVAVRCVTTDPLRFPHRAQVKWVARDAEGAELYRGAEESQGSLEIRLPEDRGEVARLDVRASDGAWARDARIAIARSAKRERVELVRLPCAGAASAAALLFAWREVDREARGTDAACTWVAFDAAGVPLSRASGRWRGGFALAQWTPDSTGEAARRFDLRNERGETIARIDTASREEDPGEGSRERPTLEVTSVDATAGVHVVVDPKSTVPAHVLLLDAERRHAQKSVATPGPIEIDLPWTADAVRPAFVVLTNAAGAGIALHEVPLASAGEIAVAAEATSDPRRWRLRCSDRHGVPVPRVVLWAFEAAPHARGPLRDLTALDPRAYEGFAEAGPDLARFGFGELALAHSSVTERAWIVKRREEDELRARRVVFGVGIALAVFCAMTAVFELLRRGRARRASGALRFAAGGAMVALVFALVAANLWWGSADLRTAGAPEPGAEVASPREFGALREVEAAAPSECGAKLSGPRTTDERGTAEIEVPWTGEARASRLVVIASTPSGWFHRAEIELPSR